MPMCVRINLFGKCVGAFFLMLSLNEVYCENISEKPALLKNFSEETSFLEKKTESLFSADLVPVSNVVIQGLDKITGRVSTMKTLVGKKVTFGRLEIVVQSCHKSPPEEMPEAIAAVKIYEKPSASSEEVLIFDNKMYASSPSVSSLDHSVYDVWIKDCF